MEKYIVNENEENIRLDKLLADKNNKISRGTYQRLIENGNVFVNDKIEKSSYKVQKGDYITVENEEVKEVALEPQDIPLDVIYEDDDIIAINKPKGMCVHPGNGNKDNTLANAIMAKCKGSLSGIGGKIRPGIVHRLDKETSGIIIVAKNDYSHIKLSEMLKQRNVKKTYMALVRGVIPENEATIDMPIGRSTKDRTKMAVTKSGKNAITHFKVLERFSNFTLLEVKIETGRTHQIRVHLAEIGYPIIGDEVYSNGKNVFNVKGQMLHAKRLEFNHPVTGKHMILEAKLPEYFEEIIKKLEGENSKDE